MSFLKGCGGDDMDSPSERAKIEALLVDLVEAEQRYEQHLQLIRAEMAELRQKLSALDPEPSYSQQSSSSELNLFPLSPSLNPSSYHLPPPPLSLEPPTSRNQIHRPGPPQIGGDNTLLTALDPESSSSYHLPPPPLESFGLGPPTSRELNSRIFPAPSPRQSSSSYHLPPPPLESFGLGPPTSTNQIHRPRPPQIGGDNTLLSSSPARNAIGPRPPQIGGDNTLLSSSPARNPIGPRPPQIGGDNTLPLVVNPGARNPIGPRPRPVPQIPLPIRLRWTEERETQFSEAVATLGGLNNADPTRLMQLMPGLTYNQLKSHLQVVRKKAGVQLPNEDEQQ